MNQINVKSLTSFSLNAIIAQILGYKPVVVRETQSPEDCASILAERIETNGRFYPAVKASSLNFVAAFATQDNIGMRGAIAETYSAIATWFWAMGMSSWFEDLESEEDDDEQFESVETLLGAAANILCRLEDVETNGYEFGSGAAELCEIVQTLRAAAKLLKFDLDQDQRTVFESMMSRFSTESDNASGDVLFYRDCGIEVWIERRLVEGQYFYLLRSVKNQAAHNGVLYTKGEIVNATRFRPVVFS